MDFKRFVTLDNIGQCILSNLSEVLTKPYLAGGVLVHVVVAKYETVNIAGCTARTVLMGAVLMKATWAQVTT